ncbi:MAG: hypothetical protein OHK93_003045 [Ramalina farinacea]|uniref:Uncharacterized protein n=1 Tax=Ramalina farinacea TaxID=258253 RepID=A0AA43TXU0_9LECA|nr:hypothetical protein [Ramalina farinacea]
MDDFIFVSQTGCPEKHSRNRELVRAHATRKHWQAVKQQATPNIHPKGQAFRITCHDCAHTSNHRSDCIPRCVPHKSKEVSLVSEANAEVKFPKAQQPPVAISRSIGHGADALAYAGSLLDAESYGYFQHYGSEFKVVLCDSIQPVRIDGSAICCKEAIQVGSPALLHAICFQAAAHVAIRQATLPLRQDMFRDPLHAHGLEQKALYHRVKALSHLRKAFGAKQGLAAASDMSILCIALLLAAEAMMGDEIGLESHASALRQLVAARGGLDRLPSSTASLVGFVDVKAALAQRRAPLFGSQISFEKQELGCSPSSKILINRTFDIHRFGRGFMEPALKLRPALLTCILQIECLTLDTLRAHRDSKYKSQYGIDDFVSLDKSLLSLKSSHELSRLDECVCLALLLFTNTALWRTPVFFNWIQNTVDDLKLALLNLYLEPINQEATELLLWAIFLGLYVTRTSSQPEYSWWSARLRDLSVRANVATFEETSQILRAFAYTDEAYASALEQIWSDRILGQSEADGTPSKQAGRPDLEMEEHPCNYPQG